MCVWWGGTTTHAICMMVFLFKVEDEQSCRDMILMACCHPPAAAVALPCVKLAPSFLPLAMCSIAMFTKKQTLDVPMCGMPLIQSLCGKFFLIRKRMTMCTAPLWKLKTVFEL